MTVLQHDGVLIGPRLLRQVFNDTQSDVPWLIIGAPEAEFLPDESQDISVYCPFDPKQPPAKLAGAEWPPTM